MPQDTEAKITVRIETADAERDLQRIRRAIGQDFGGRGGGGGGGSDGGGGGGGPRIPGARPPPQQPQGLGVSSAAIASLAKNATAMAAAAIAMKEVASDLKSVARDYLGGFQRGVARGLGTTPHRMMADARRAARDAAISDVGIGGAFMSREERDALVGMHYRLEMMKQRSREAFMDDFDRRTFNAIGIGEYRQAQK